MEAFSLQKVVEMLEEVVVSWREDSPENLVDEAKLCSPIRSTFEVLVVWRVVQHCHAEEPGPSC